MEYTIKSKKVVISSDVFLKNAGETLSVLTEHPTFDVSPSKEDIQKALYSKIAHIRLDDVFECDLALYAEDSMQGFFKMVRLVSVNDEQARKNILELFSKSGERLDGEKKNKVLDMLLG